MKKIFQIIVLLFIIIFGIIIVSKIEFGSSSFEVKIEEGKDFILPIVKGNELKMIWVAPGEFSMVSVLDNDNNRTEEEKIYEVKLENGFWVAETAISQVQYERVLNIDGNGDELLQILEWKDVEQFLQKLNEEENAKGRLPTGYYYGLLSEEQWEFAARGGLKSNDYKYSGSDDYDKVAARLHISFIEKIYEVFGKKICRELLFSSPLSIDYFNKIKLKGAVGNELGIYCMTGAQMEWCQSMILRNYIKYDKECNHRSSDIRDYRGWRGVEHKDIAGTPSIGEKQYVDLQTNSVIEGANNIKEKGSVVEVPIKITGNIDNFLSEKFNLTIGKLRIALLKEYDEPIIRNKQQTMSEKYAELLEERMKKEQERETRERGERARNIYSDDYDPNYDDVE